MKTVFSYHASHEQFAPSELLKFAVSAELAGFGGISSSDHFHPWSSRQGQSGFSFAWLGAAMAITSLPFSVVCSPGQRYHPAIVAQAIATLNEMFPGRFMAALGSGEALNESITGEKWPDKTLRNQRLRECYDIVSRLLEGETVNHKGLVVTENAKLYTLPGKKPQVICAAVSKETAHWAGSWADGLITTHRPPDELHELVNAFRTSGGHGKPVYLKVQLSYAENKQRAIEGAHEQWRTNIFSGGLLGDLPSTAHFDEAAKMVSPDEMYKHVLISDKISQHIDWLTDFVKMGFTGITLHNVNREQSQFIADFGKHVLPALSAIAP